MVGLREGCREGSASWWRRDRWCQCRARRRSLSPWGCVSSAQGGGAEEGIFGSRFLGERWAAAHEQKHASGGGEFAGMVADGAVGPICGLSWSVWTREGGRVRPWVVVSSLVAVWVHGVARAKRTDFL